MEPIAEPMDDADFVRIARALADPNRVRILERIRCAERLHCGALVQDLPLAQATVSHHLKELTASGLLVMEEVGQHNYYTFRADRLAAFITELMRRFHLCDGSPPRP